MSAVDFAKRAIKANLSVVPVRPGGKLPASKWKTWQSSIMGLAEVDSFFTRNDLGIICGAVSGGVECLDFDDPDAFHEWKEFISNHGYEDTLNSCYIQQTPSGGWHVVYRTDSLQGNLKLAWGSDNSSDKAKIETRGEGGYFKCYPSKGYQAKNSNLLDLPKLNTEEHDAFIGFARMLTEKITDKECGTAIPGSDSDTPGMDFVKRGNWDEILTPHGWTVSHKRGDITYWVRPGKTKRDGISATTGHAGLDYFYVFTTSTSFTSGRAYNKFAVFAYLNHGGDFNTAARELKRAGFGKQAEGVPPLKESQGLRNPNPPKSTGLSVTQFGDSFKEVKPEYLVSPYLRKGKGVLLDADGGTSKTTLAIALSAWLSRGMSMIGDMDCGPVNTLYLHRFEDENDELHTVYLRNNGDPNRIFYITPEHQWVPTVEGCKQLEETIRDLDIKLVVLDPLFSFLSSLSMAKDLMKDQMAVYEALTPLMDVYSRTGAVGLHIRHTTKGNVDKAASELGMGSAGFRNRHRGQLVMRYHPDKEKYRGVVGLTDEKGSLLSPKGEPFFFRKTDNLEIQQILNIDEDPWEKRPVATGGKKQEAANEWLMKTLTGSIRYVTELRRMAEDEGIAPGALYRAKTALGVIETTTGGRKTWAYDPYA